MAGPLINNNYANSNDNIQILTDDPVPLSRDEKVDIYFCGSGFSSDMKLGATPLMSITREFIKDGAGSYIGINNKINLTGKIYDSGNPGIDIILKDKEENLKQLLKTGVGDLEVKSGNARTLFGENAKVVGYSIDKTPDQWVYTADYSIDFSYYESIAKSDYRVSSVSESWSLEPVGEMLYFALNKPVTKRTETEPTAATNLTSVMVTGLPQFRLNRKISAVGVRSKSFISHDKSSRHQYNFSGGAGGATSGGDTAENDAYWQAKKWVEDRLNLPFSSTNNSKNDYTSKLASAYNITNFTNLFVCNHTRSINFSITDGSYEVNDSWLALPSGVRHTEEFTIENSTDEKFINTVKVQGIIKGLQVTNSSIVTTNTDIPNTTGKIDIGKYKTSGMTGSINSKQVKSEKYQNALDAWIDDIKPTLYTRACLALRSPDRTQDYYPSNYNGGTTPPGNPAFRKENLLNIIPISSSESHDALKGAIGYTYEYTNATKIFSGVIAESVSINHTGPGRYMAEVFVLGRPLGPVIQDLGTDTTCSKSVNIELIIPPPTTSAAFNIKNNTCPVWTGGYIFQTCESIIEGQKPYGQRLTDSETLPNTSHKGVYNSSLGPFTGDVYVKSDTYSWSPSEGRYTRNVEWVYQRANTNNYSFLKLGG